jgi:KDO2-lipid IV(A) lauroyltransferase
MKNLLKLRYLLEFTLILFLYYLFKVLGLRVSRFFWKNFVGFLGTKLPVNKVVKKNIDICFPDLNQKQKNVLAKQIWQNFGIIIAEFPFMHKISKNIEKYIDEESLQKAKQMAGKHKKLIFCSGHVANWELLGPVNIFIGFKQIVFYRRVNNQYLDNWVRRNRKDFVQDYIPKSLNAAKKILEFAKDKNANSIALLIDQKDSRGIEIEFFGKKVAASDIFAQVSNKYKIPIIFFALKRTANYKYELESTLIEPKENSKEIIEQAYGYLEEYIKQNPSQWFFMHKRFDKKLYD